MPFSECLLNVTFSSCTIRDEVLCISHQFGSLQLNSVRIYIQPLPKVFNLNFGYSALDYIVYQLQPV